MSTLKFLHEKKNISNKDGKRMVEEENIIDGDKGLYVKYFSQEGEDRMKIIIKSKDDKFILVITKGKDDSKEETLTRDELLKTVAKHKVLAFALPYLKDRKMSRTKKMGGGSRKSSRKSSRKASKKASKKRSKKSRK